MGLDMYLNKSTYVKNWNHFKESEKNSIEIKKGGKVRDDIKPDRITYIIEEVGYWRKFNALHSWIVKNVANGEDDCQRIYLTQAHMVLLLDDLNLVKKSLDNSEKDENGNYMIDDVALKLLPPADGFFFGSLKIDEWYYSEICKSIEIFEECITSECITSKSGVVYYQASW